MNRHQISVSRRTNFILLLFDIHSLQIFWTYVQFPLRHVFSYTKEYLHRVINNGQATLNLYSLDVHFFSYEGQSRHDAPFDN